MYQNDPDLDDLLNKPLLMAMDQDEDYEDEEEDDDLFGDDILQAAISAKEEEEEEAAAFAASLLGEPVEDVEEAPPEDVPVQPAQKWFTRPGVRWNEKHPNKYALFTIVSCIPLALLFVLKFSLGLGAAMEVFTWLFLIGLGFSFYNLVYYIQQRDIYTVSFNVRSFFRFWPDVVVVGLVLITISLVNLNNMNSSQPLVTLTGEKLSQVNIFKTSDGVENEEVAKIAQATDSSSEPQSPPADAVTDPEEELVDLIEPMAQSSGDATASMTAQPLEGEDLPAGKYNSWFKKPVAGAVVGFIGSMEENIPPGLLPKTESSAMKLDLSHASPLINTLFAGGALTAAFGYAFVLGIAGALIGVMRRIDTPFSKKSLELINIENAETEVQNLDYSNIKVYFNVVYKALMGLTYGGTLGFILGVAIVLPLVFMFGDKTLANPSLAALLSALGVVNYPDLAFSNAVTLGGLMVPLVIGIVAKMSPQGMSVSEETIRQHYEFKPQGRFIPSDQPVMMGGSGGISPVAVTFFGADDELETTQLMKELTADEESLTAEIIDEFGREFEQIFGIDTRELLGKQSRKETVDKKKLASALDESFGELGNVPVEISAELGQASILVTEWLNLKEGTLVLLDKPADEEIDILFNGVRKGKGKLIVSENALSVKVSNTNFSSNNGHVLKSEIGV